MKIYMEYFPYKPLKKVVYKERFGIILEFRVLYRTVQYKHLWKGIRWNIGYNK